MSQTKSLINKIKRKSSTISPSAHLGDVHLAHSDDERSESPSSELSSTEQQDYASDPDSPSVSRRDRRHSRVQQHERKFSTEETHESHSSQDTPSPAPSSPSSSTTFAPIGYPAHDEEREDGGRDETRSPKPTVMVQISKVSSVSHNVTKMHARMQAVHDAIDDVNASDDDEDIDPFEDAGSEPGLQVWHVARKKPVLVSRDKMGKFCSGDCYIILYTYPGASDDSTKCIHYWIGKDASFLKSAVCVLLTLDLHEKLDRKSSHYREVQNEESERFIAYFAENNLRIQYIPGGITESGLNKVEQHTDFEKRLIQITGATTELLYVKRIPVRAQSLTKEDVFVFESSPQRIYVWMGRNSSKAKQLKAIAIATLIKQEERKGQPQVEFVQQGEETDEFTSLIIDNDDEEDDEEPEASTSAAGEDEEEGEESEDDVILYRVRVNPDTAKIDVKTIDDRPLTREMLFTTCAYVLECKFELYVWYGKKCKEIERKYALALALKLKKLNETRKMEIESMFEDAETVLFKQRFHIGFYLKDTPELWTKRRAELENVSKVKLEETYAVFEETEDEEDKSMIDDGLGKFHIWRVVDNKKIEAVKDSEMGHFHSGDCYIIWYQQNVEHAEEEDDDEEDEDGDEEDEDEDEVASEQLAAYRAMKRKAKKKKIFFVPIRVLYFWEGHDSDQRQFLNFWRKNWKKISSDQKNAPRIVNVEQYKEPDHIMKIFDNCLVVHRGSSAVPRANKSGLYRVYCKNRLNTRAIEVEPRRASLNSGDVYIMRGISGNYLWIGKYATELKKRSAWVLATSVTGDHAEPIVVDEGFEMEEFWEELTDGNVAAQGYLSERLPLETRVLMCSLTPTGYKVLCLGDLGKQFTFEDLRSCYYVIIVHAVYKVYVWYPSQLAFSVERRLALKHAQDLAERSEKVTPEIVEIHRNEEPDSFKFLFPEWGYRERVFTDIHETNRKQVLAQLQEDYRASLQVLSILHGATFSPLLQTDTSVNTENALFLYRATKQAESFSKLSQYLRESLRAYPYTDDVANPEPLLRQLTSQLWNTIRPGE